jgi:hypothetical protein
MAERATSTTVACGDPAVDGGRSEPGRRARTVVVPSAPVLPAWAKCGHGRGPRSGPPHTVALLAEVAQDCAGARQPLVGSLVGSLRHGTRCTGPHQMDDGANRTAAQSTGTDVMDERARTPSPQVLGSNPRGRTRKVAVQRLFSSPLRVYQAGMLAHRPEWLIYRSSGRSVVLQRPAAVAGRSVRPSSEFADGVAHDGGEVPRARKPGGRRPVLAGVGQAGLGRAARPWCTASSWRVRTGSCRSGPRALRYVGGLGRGKLHRTPT